MEEKESEIEDRPGHRLAIDHQVLFVQMPATWTRDEHRGFFVQLVMLAALAQADRAAHRIAQIDLAVDQVVPRRAVGVLEVGHESRGTRVERVDDHLAIGRAGELHAPVEHVLRLRTDLPLALANAARLGQKVGKATAVEFLLPLGAALEKLLAALVELAVQLRHERERFGREDLRELRRNACVDGDVVRFGHGALHDTLYVAKCGVAT